MVWSRLRRAGGGGSGTPSHHGHALALATIAIVLVATSGGAIERAAAAAPPPAPTIDAPASGEVITERRPAIRGTGVPANKVAVRLAGAEVCHNTPVKPDGTWECQPSTDLPVGRVRLVAVQVDNGQLESPAASVTFLVAPPAPVISTPSPGARVRDRTPRIKGSRAVAGARVRVFDRGRQICAAVAPRSGRWSCTPRSALRRGTHVLRASQRYRSADSPLSPKVAFRIVVP
ncbi:hypothetical protein E7Z54_03825, partial [Nocardioides sp.]